MSDSQKKAKLLFVCHIASLSGAPILLLEIIKEFKSRSDVPFNILVVKEGGLTHEFRNLGNTFIWNYKLKEPTVLLSNRLINIFNKIKWKIYQRYILFKLRGTTLVFLNTLSNGHIHEKLLFLKCAFVHYVHEMQIAIHSITTDETRKIITNHTHLFIACSNAVKQNLIVNIGVPDVLVKVFSTPLSNVNRDKKEYAGFINNFKKTHNVPGNATIIGAVGASEWRKGFDLFLPMISLYFCQFPGANTYFIWKGLSLSDKSSFIDLYDYNKHDHKDRIIFLPHDNDGINTIACLDIHVLLSREDPYPLVVLEAASLTIPTVCFTNAGGAPEFVEEDSGISVPYLDLTAMARALNKLANDVEERKRMGIKAKEKVMSRHANAVCMPAFLNVLQNNFVL